jgi:hypothetical protein
LSGLLRNDTGFQILDEKGFLGFTFDPASGDQHPVSVRTLRYALCALPISYCFIHFLCYFFLRSRRVDLA